MLSILHQRTTCWVQSIKTTFGLLLGITVSVAGTPLAVEAATPDMVGKTIVVDAGHGGRDSGAQGITGVQEKDVALGVAKDLEVLLRQNGAKVVMTRTVDDDLATREDRLSGRRQRADLTNRVQLAKSAGPDLFVSIHCNSIPSPAWRGAQTLYMQGHQNSKQAAEIIQDSFRENLLPTGRSPAAVSSLFLLKHIHAPSVLTEIGFLSNPEEEQQLATKAYQEQVAFALYTGILGYFQVEPKGWKTYIAHIFHAM